jgi:trehalose 6-phosphate synthase
MVSSIYTNLLEGRKLIVALNSQPYTHYKTHSGIQVKRGSGGAQHLMDYIMKKTGGTMIAVSSGTADKAVVDKNNKIKVPPGEEEYTLKRLFLNKKDLEEYYNGFANQTLWPLCHMSFVKPLFEKRWWNSYKKVNELFAEAILEEAKDTDAFVWVNDYQLCLVPKYLKEKNKKIKVGMFWHIPWPIKELFSLCPWSTEILEGLLTSDFIGFHQENYIHNFVATAISELKIDILPNDNSIYYKQHITKFDYLPAGIDYGEINNYISKNESAEDAVKKDFDIDYEKLIIGVDRIDHTKGLIERIRILDVFFETYPEYRGKLVHLLIGSPSRQLIPSYNNLTIELKKEIDTINWKYGEGSWNPVYFVNATVQPHKVYQYYNCADVCIVSSLDDGMNLVAKEYPICAKDHKGALVLSKYTGASKQLTPAFSINPFNVADSAEKIYKALTLSSGEKVKKNTEMKKILQSYDLDKWTKEFFTKTLSKPY